MGKTPEVDDEDEYEDEYIDHEASDEDEEASEEPVSDDPVRAAVEKSWDKIEAKEPDDDSTPKKTDLRIVQKESSVVLPAAKQGAMGSDAKGGAAGVLVDPPLSWKADEKDLFRSLPSPLQETIARRESERERAFNEGMMKISEYARRYQGISDVFNEEEKEELLRANLSEAQLLGQFVGTQRWLNRDPKAAIKHIAASYNLSPQDLLDDDRVNQVDPRVQQLESQLATLTQHVQGNYAQQHQAHVGNVRSSVVALAEEKDAQGNPTRPHFDEVWQDMLPIVQFLRQSNPDAPPQTVFAEAYDRAIYSNPSVRAKVLASEQAKRMQEEKEKARKARFAGSSVRGNPTAGMMSRQSEPKSIEDFANEAWDELST